MLESCDRQVRQFEKLVEELLDLSRIAAGRLEMQVADVDLAAVVRDVAGRFAMEFDRAGCAFECQAAAAVVGRWDRTRLEQVVANLLSNAVKYGAGTPVGVVVEQVDGRARLTVRDRGIGIAAEAHGRIFERFERGVTGFAYGGLGMGLYIVRQLVAAMGGVVRVESELGKGAAFVVELPLDGTRADGRSAVAFDHE